MTNQAKCFKGMSLAEVLVAISILSMIMLSIGGTISITFSSVRVDKDITMATSFAQQKLEQIKASVSDTSEFTALSSIPYSFITTENENTRKLIYNVDVTTIDINGLKKVTVKVYYHNGSVSPSPRGDKLFQISTFIAAR